MMGVLTLALACGREGARDAAMPEDTMSAASPPSLVPADTALLDSVPPDTIAPAPGGTPRVVPPPETADTPPVVDTAPTAETPKSDSTVKPNIDPRPADPLPRIPRGGATTP